MWLWRGGVSSCRGHFHTAVLTPPLLYSSRLYAVLYAAQLLVCLYAALYAALLLVCLYAALLLVCLYAGLCIEDLPIALASPGLRKNKYEFG